MKLYALFKNGKLSLMELYPSIETGKETVSIHFDYKEFNWEKTWERLESLGYSIQEVKIVPVKNEVCYTVDTEKLETFLKSKKLK